MSYMTKEEWLQDIDHEQQMKSDIYYFMDNSIHYEPLVKAILRFKIECAKYGWEISSFSDLQSKLE